MIDAEVWLPGPGACRHHLVSTRTFEAAGGGETRIGNRCRRLDMSLPRQSRPYLQFRLQVDGCPVAVI